MRSDALRRVSCSVVHASHPPGPARATLRWLADQPAACARRRRRLPRRRATASWARRARSPRRRSRRCREARGKNWRAVNNLGEALDDVVEGRSVAAMIAIENSIEGGVSGAQDALATIPGLRIVGEYLVPVQLRARRPARARALADVRDDQRASGRLRAVPPWLDRNLPAHGHLPASSNVAAARLAARGQRGGCGDRAARDRRPPRRRRAGREHRRQPERRDPVRAGEHAAPAVPAPTGADKTSLIAELPDDRPGSLLDLLEQFSTRGVNLSLHRVAADRRRARPVPVRHRRRRAHRTTSGWRMRCSACAGSARRSCSSARTRGRTARASSSTSATGTRCSPRRASGWPP